MKCNRYISLIPSILVTLLFICCSSNPFVGTWQGKFKRAAGNVWESWTFKILDDGTCYAKEQGSGDVNYTQEYSGIWTPVENNIIKLELGTGQIPTTTTDGLGHYKHYMADHRVTYYIRDDGAADVFIDDLNSPRMWLK